MNLKQALLVALETDQLKQLCAELELEADRRSRDAMSDALAGARRAKPELLIAKLTVAQLRGVLKQLGQSIDGSKEELAQRLQVAGGRVSPFPQATTLPAEDKGAGNQAIDSPGTRAGRSSTSDFAAEYRHRDEAVQRPGAGVQDHFQVKKPPRVYRYDSSLDPALSWDEQRERDLGEWLLGMIVRSVKEGEAAVFAEPQVWKGGGVHVNTLSDAAQMLWQLGKPILNWAGKVERHEIRVPTAPLFVHERHSTKAVLYGIRHRKARGQTLDLFADADLDIRENLEAYEHKGPWQNRMILGDSLAVMNSLLEFEGLSGQVQMIYIDPPYGVKFGSNFQPFVRKRDVKHAADGDMTREPEMVKAYRDTWELGLHSYLTYLRDRLMVARELLHQSGSVFLQISDDNLHLVRVILDEVFGMENFVNLLAFKKTGFASDEGLATTHDFILWYARDRERLKSNRLYLERPLTPDELEFYDHIELTNGTRRPLTREERTLGESIRSVGRVFSRNPMVSPGWQDSLGYIVHFQDSDFVPPANRHWATHAEGVERLRKAGRLAVKGNTLRFVRFFDDFALDPLGTEWNDTGVGGFVGDERIYVVQTDVRVVERCLLLATEPGDLVLDPTCGSGTTAFAAEKWGRRWITIDTSRVPLALARQRLLTAVFSYYKLRSPQAGPVGGFVYERKQNRRGEDVGGLVPHITLKSIANDEPATMEMVVDRPEEVSGVTRVSGPFVVEATIAPAQPLEASSHDVASDGDVSTHIERMTELLRQSKTLRLPGNRELTLGGVRRTVDTEYLHAEAKEGDKLVAIVFGPADGAVTTALVYEAGREAHYLKYERLYFFGFAVEPGARAMIEDEKKLRIPAAYVAVTPDVAMSDLLKTTRASEIFSVTGLPDVTVRRTKKSGPEGQPLYEVELQGLDLFDPESMGTESVDGESVPCWMLDTDYDGLCFYATQVFFPKTGAWDNLQRSLKAKFDDSVWSHLAGTVSEPFALGERRRVAVKVIDERGNELMRALEVSG
jgi:adenine-specific DNA-methyltransferase